MAWGKEDMEYKKQNPPLVPTKVLFENNTTTLGLAQIASGIVLQFIEKGHDTPSNETYQAAAKYLENVFNRYTKD